MRSTTIIFFGFFIMQLAFAGDKIGNGGGLWVCQTASRQIQSAILVDLFEAKVEFALTLAPTTSLMAQDIAVEKTKMLASVNTVITQKMNTYLNEVFQKIQFVNAVLEKVEDALYRIEPLPATCPSGQWQYSQFANFTAQNQVLIRNDYWTSPLVSELDKAALLVHEAIYRWMRVEYNDINSVRTRQIVGLLFSNLNVTEMNQKIKSLLGPSSTPGILDTWACMIKNSHAHRIFIGYGETQMEAQIQSAKICSDQTDAFYCNKTGATCEQAQSNAYSWMCASRDSATFRDFTGKGRTQVEATYETLKSCEDSSNDGFFCGDVVCNKK